MPQKKKTKSRKRERKPIVKGKAYIQATFNNTIVTLSDPDGNVIAWASSGSAGFKGSRKSTPFSAQWAGEKCARSAMRFGVREVEIKVKGPGSGRESAISAIQGDGLRVSSIEDVTPIPHNGCRAPKRRRV